MANLVTVGIPVHNAMPYLKEAVESLLAQTVSNFKILLILDGCTDDSLAYISTIRDSRLKIIQQPKSGLTRSLNRMLREAETPWLMRQDADDVSYPERVEQVIEYIKRYPDSGMFYSMADYYPKDRCLGQFRCSRGTPEELRCLVESGYMLSICHPSVTLNRGKALEIGAYREGLYIEDADLWWRIALAHEIHFIPVSLVGYRLHGSSITAQGLLAQQLGTLYVQYCLLSHLWSLSPKPFEQVKANLESFLAVRDLDAKEQMRSVNMFLAERKFLSATGAALRCFFTSPRFIAKRIFDELSPSPLISNGVAPRLFLQQKQALWS